MPFFPVLELSQCLCLPSRHFQILYLSLEGSSTDTWSSDIRYLAGQSVTRRRCLHITV